MTRVYLNLIRFCFSIPHVLCTEKIMIKKQQQQKKKNPTDPTLILLSMKTQTHIFFFWSNLNLGQRNSKASRAKEKNEDIAIAGCMCHILHIMLLVKVQLCLH